MRRRKGQKKVPSFEDMKTSGEEETKDVTRGKVVVISIKNGLMIESK